MMVALARSSSLTAFTTSALVESGYAQVRSAAEKQGLTVDDREFHCAGSFKALHAGKPDEDDLNRLRKFAAQFLA